MYKSIIFPKFKKYILWLKKKKSFIVTSLSTSITILEQNKYNWQQYCIPEYCTVQSQSLKTRPSEMQGGKTEGSFYLKCGEWQRSNKHTEHGAREVRISSSFDSPCVFVRTLALETSQIERPLCLFSLHLRGSRF